MSADEATAPVGRRVRGPAGIVRWVRPLPVVEVTAEELEALDAMLAEVKADATRRLTARVRELRADLDWHDERAAAIRAELDEIDHNRRIV